MIILYPQIQLHLAPELCTNIYCISDWSPKDIVSWLPVNTFAWCCTCILKPNYPEKSSFALRFPHLVFLVYASACTHYLESSPCWFHLQNIFRIGYLLAAPTATTLIPAPSGATPRSRWQLFRLLLQSLLHVAAQEDVCNTFTGMTVPLAILSWLPIPREIKFTPDLVFKALQIWFHLYFQTWLQSFFPTNIH